MIRGISRRSALLAAAGAAVMVAVLMPALLYGDFRGEGARLLQMPWGRATLVEAYVGLVLFSAWVLRREDSRIAGFAWVLAILAVGNLAACCYVLRAAAAAKDDSVTFWMGGRREA